MYLPRGDANLGSAQQTTGAGPSQRSGSTPPCEGWGGPQIAVGALGLTASLVFVMLWFFRGYMLQGLRQKVKRLHELYDQACRTFTQLKNDNEVFRQQIADYEAHLSEGARREYPEEPVNLEDKFAVGSDSESSGDADSGDESDDNSSTVSRKRDVHIHRYPSPRVVKPGQVQVVEVAKCPNGDGVSTYLRTAPELQEKQDGRVTRAPDASPPLRPQCSRRSLAEELAAAGYDGSDESEINDESATSGPASCAETKAEQKMILNLGNLNLGGLIEP